MVQESLTVLLLQSTAPFPLLYQAPIRASSKSDFCELSGRPTRCTPHCYASEDTDGDSSKIHNYKIQKLPFFGLRCTIHSLTASFFVVGEG